MSRFSKCISSLNVRIRSYTTICKTIKCIQLWSIYFIKIMSKSDLLSINGWIYCIFTCVCTAYKNRQIGVYQSTTDHLEYLADFMWPGEFAWSYFSMLETGMLLSQTFLKIFRQIRRISMIESEKGYRRLPVKKKTVYKLLVYFRAQ